MLKLVICIALILTAHESCEAQQPIECQVVDRRDGKGEDSAQIEIVVASTPPHIFPVRRFINDTIFCLVAIQYTNQTGNIRIDSLSPGIYYFISSKWMDSIGERTTFTRIVIPTDGQDTIRLAIPDLCKFHTESNVSGICPRCMSKSHVIPVVYGEPGDKMLESAERNEILLGGCVIDDYCEAHWYCTIHKIKF